MSIRKFLRDSSFYGSANILVLISSLISFPLITHTLSVGEYGVLNLIAAILPLLVVLAKAGNSKAIIRFYSDYALKQNKLNTFNATVTIGLLTSALIITVIYGTLMYWAGHYFFPNTFEKYSLLFYLIMPALIVSSLTSGLTNTLLAMERSFLFSSFLVATKYASLILVVSVLVFWRQDALAVFSSTLIIDAIALSIMFAIVYKSQFPKLGDYDIELHKKMLVFGVPLIGWEASHLLINFGDRFIINIFYDEVKLGLYSAPYNLANYIYFGLFNTLAVATLPIATRLWENHSLVETTDFLNKSVSIYTMIGIPSVIGIWVLGNDILVLVASDKYLVDRNLLPLIILGFFFKGLVDMYSIGLYVKSRSSLMFKVVSISALINLVLNVILIPGLGLIGAAAASLIANLFMFFFIYVQKETQDLLGIPWRALATSVTASLLMATTIATWQAETILLSTLVKILLGASSYLLFIVILDRYPRNLVKRFSQSLLLKMHNN